MMGNRPSTPPAPALGVELVPTNLCRVTGRIIERYNTYLTQADDSRTYWIDFCMHLQDDADSCAARDVYEWKRDNPHGSASDRDDVGSESHMGALGDDEYHHGLERIEKSEANIARYVKAITDLNNMLDTHKDASFVDVSSNDVRFVDQDGDTDAIKAIIAAVRQLGLISSPDSVVNVGSVAGLVTFLRDKTREPSTI